MHDGGLGVAGIIVVISLVVERLGLAVPERADVLLGVADAVGRREFPDVVAETGDGAVGGGLVVVGFNGGRGIDYAEHESRFVDQLRGREILQNSLKRFPGGAELLEVVLRHAQGVMGKGGVVSEGRILENFGEDLFSHGIAFVLQVMAADPHLVADNDVHPAEFLVVVVDLLVSFESRVRIAELVFAERDVFPASHGSGGAREIFLHLAEKF